MKELERAFGVYVSWNSARLSSGDYEIVYTRSHDMSAGIYTKGFDDAALFQRLLLLTNLYSPEQWESGLIRPAPLLGDKSPAEGSPLFDPSLINSQWSIYLMGVAQEQDNRKAIKKKPPKKKASSFTIEPCWYPSVPGVDGEYRTDCGVTNYQIPTEEGTSSLEHVFIRRTWCLSQRVLWLDELFCSKDQLKEITDALQPAAAVSPLAETPSPEWNILNNFTKQYLTRKIYWKKI